MPDLKNVIVAYHGGGYDGCIWEWNYAYFDEDGEFHDIYSSGVLGCPTHKQLMDRITLNDDAEINIVEVGNEESLRNFADTEGLNGVATCVQWFKENFPHVKFSLKCDCCGERFDPSQAHYDDWVGIGGIESEPSSVICKPCCEQHTCSNCNEYYGPDHKFSSTAHYSHACESCTEEDGGPEE